MGKGESRTPVTDLGTRNKDLADDTSIIFKNVKNEERSKKEVLVKRGGQPDKISGTLGIDASATDERAASILKNNSKGKDEDEPEKETFRFGFTDKKLREVNSIRTRGEMGYS